MISMANSHNLHGERIERSVYRLLLYPHMGRGWVMVVVVIDGMAMAACNNLFYHQQICREGSMLVVVVMIILSVWGGDGDEEKGGSERGVMIVRMYPPGVAVEMVPFCTVIQKK